MKVEAEKKNEVYGILKTDPSESGMSDSDIQVICVGMDLLVSVLSAFFALFLWNLKATPPVSIGWYYENFLWVLVLPSMTLAVFSLTGLYLYCGAAQLREAIYSIAQGLIVLLLIYYTIYFFISETYSIPRIIVLIYAAVSFPLFALWRKGMLWLTNNSPIRRNCLVVGEPDGNEDLLKKLTQNALGGIRPIGIYSCSSSRYPREHGEQTLKFLNPDRQLKRYVKRMRVTDLLITPRPSELSDALVSQIIECHRLGVNICTSLQFLKEHTGRYPVADARENWHRVFPYVHSKNIFFRFAKRCLDITGALVGLLLLAPLFPFLAAGIKLSSTGPVFFRQERIGRGGKPFTLVKLRTMVENAEEKTGAQWASEEDPRVTGFGWFLRKTHLDEFPQFWNVFKGEMSLVGPRPERPVIEKDLVRKNLLFKIRHSVKPGLTGWATINQNYVDSEETATRRLEYDLHYIDNQSLWFDLHIIFVTCWKMILLSGR